MKSFEQIKARMEGNREANLALEQEAEKEIFQLQIELRKKASNNSFALECWKYYRENYMGKAYKNAIFSRNYLKDALAHIE